MKNPLILSLLAENETNLLKTTSALAVREESLADSMLAGEENMIY